MPCLIRGEEGHGGRDIVRLADAAQRDAVGEMLDAALEIAIGVDLSGTYAFGATVADFWGERGEKDNARIAHEVDADRFFKLMFDLLRD